MVSWIQWVGQVGDLSEENQKHPIYGSFRKLDTKVYFEGKCAFILYENGKSESAFILKEQEKNIIFPWSSGFHAN